ncbi:MAG: hypothetical protein JO020_05125 [Chloroflexi bacterium]|nr:hypothetical protein [Chloroflexota bacterium]MBV9893532.1 hypothetical protein [Chloroflexota bacterium]
MTLPRQTSTTVVDLYLARGRLRAEIPMLGFSRLSDLFNNVPGDFVGAYTYLAATATRRDLVVRLHDVRLIRPIEEQPPPVILNNLRDRLPARVVLDLDDWQVTGEIHLVDRIPWLEFATGARNRFISVNNASVRFVGVAEPLECQYLLVNGARISALYEVD